MINWIHWTHWINRKNIMRSILSILITALSGCAPTVMKNTGVNDTGLSSGDSSSLSSEVKDYLVDPITWEDHILDNFKLEANQLSLIRQSVLWWDGAESGAPRLDPEKPFGKVDLFAQLGALLPGNSSEEDKAEFYASMTHALGYFVANATLKPGEYEITNLSMEDVRYLMQGYYRSDASGLTPEELGFSDSGKVVMSDEMIALVKGAYWEWSNEWENRAMLEEGWWPAPAIDPKRPYGDMSFIELDMHRILEWPVEKRDEDGYIRLTDAQQEQLSLLHLRLLAATQVFLEQAELP